MGNQIAIMQDAAGHAGAEAARLDPPRVDGPFDGHRPLQLFLETLPAARCAMGTCGAASFYFGVANLAPKIAIGKVEVEQLGDNLIIDGQGAVRVLPLVGATAHYHAILDVLASKRTVALAPKHVVKPLGKSYVTTKLQDEYLIRTETLQALPGSRLANVRNLVSKARRACTLEWFSPDVRLDYLALNGVWYRQNAKAKFRTYDKLSIDWLLNHWRDVAERAPDLRCLGVRHEGRLINFTIASMLTADTWSAYTERFDREAPVQGANWLAWQELARGPYAHVPLENDGTADTPALRHNKGKLVAALLPFFKVSP